MLWWCVNVRAEARTYLRGKCNGKKKGESKNNGNRRSRSPSGMTNKKCNSEDFSYSLSGVVASWGMEAPLLRVRRPVWA